jgi:regulator of replication initiation timing
MINTDELKRLAEAAPKVRIEASNSDERYEREDHADSWSTFHGRSVDGNFFITITGFDKAKNDAERWALYIGEVANPSAILSLIEEVEGLREMFGKLQVENVTLREELDKAQACLKQVDLLTQYSNGTPEAQMFAVQQLVRDHRASAFTERHKSQGESDEKHGGRE